MIFHCIFYIILFHFFIYLGYFYAQHSTAQHSTAQHSTAQHSTAQHSTAQHSTAQHSTAQHSTAQHSTAQHSTAQHSTAQHSTAQHNYVISLTTEQKRRKHITEEFGKQNIPFAFFDAITPDLIEETSKKFNITFDRSSKATLCDAEIACALSHIVLWNFVLENNLDYINIFEDDIYLGENAKELLNIDYIPEDTDILKLEAHGKIIYGKREQIKCNRNISRLKFKHTGMAGYSITAKGARYLLNNIRNKQLYLAIDTLIFDELLSQKDYKVMQLSPAICAQSFILHDENYFESSLHNGREKVHKNQIPAKPLDKIKNELIRIKKRIFGKQVPFK